MKKSIVVIGIGIGLNIAPILLAQREPRPSVTTTPITNRIYNLYVHEYVNMIVFTGPEGSLLVDSGFEPLNLIEDALKEIGVKRIKYIINTHCNGDHIRGNAAFGEDAVIISSSWCRDDMKKREDFPEAGLSDMTFDDSLQIYFNDETINLRFMPGHTGTDIVVHFEKANIVCLGDLVFTDSFPGSQVDRGGDVFVLKKNLGKIIELFGDDTKFMVSHIRDYSMADLKEYYEMTRKTINLVIPLIEKGYTLEEIKKRDPLKDWKSWDSMYFPGEITADTWIENIFESVKSNNPCKW